MFSVLNKILFVHCELLDNGFGINCDNACLLKQVLTHNVILYTVYNYNTYIETTT